MAFKMKIAFLSFYSGEVYRGVETYVHELANRLADMGHDVTVFQNGPILPFSDYKTIKIEIPVDWDRKGSYVPFLSYWALLVKSFTHKVLSRIDKDTDVVFATNGQWQSILTRIWCFINKKTLLISGQSGPGFDDRLNLWCFPDRFIALTEFQAKWARNINPLVKVEIIPNGVDLSKFKSSQESLKLSLPRPIILSVAALVGWKRLDLAIRGVAKLEKGSLLIVGQGDEKAKLQKLGNELLPGRFKILTFPHIKMPAVYASADIFTFPTVPWESFGIVLIEAMSANLPVVAMDDPIRKEIVGDAGLFVDPKDPQKYANVLEKALGTKWGSRPRQQAEKFNWDAIAKEYEQLLQSLQK